jgi:hypothetical protein
MVVQTSKQTNFLMKNLTLDNITPLDIEKYFKWRAFGIHNNGETNDKDDTTKLCHAYPLEFYKVNISFFIPNQIRTWDPLRKSGNPTKSTEVKEVIKIVTIRMQRQWCHRKGQTCNAKNDFLFAIGILDKKDSVLSLILDSNHDEISISSYRLI